MNRRRDWLARCVLILLAGLPLFSMPSHVAAEEDYSFDLEEFEPEKFDWGGYAESKWEHIDLNTDGSFYLLKFHKDPRSNMDRFTDAIQLEGSYKDGIGAFNAVLRAEAVQDDIGWSAAAGILEANLSLRPSPFATIDVGKKTFKWGKGYAWNPVAFIDRPKDPSNPEEALEGYIGVGVDLIKSLDGPLQTVALTGVALPVWEGVNEDFGETNHINLAAKLYMLYRDTDIDLAVFTGGSRSTRYGIDFSRNLSSNFEIHGEFAYLTNLEQVYLTEAGTLAKRGVSVEKYLLGLRYLTRNDITTIIEFYHNGAGYSEPELARFHQLVDDANRRLVVTGRDDLFQAARDISNMGYGTPHAGRNYLYMRTSQKDSFDILYFTPALTTTFNLDDKSYSVTPELAYTGFTNWELRLRFTHQNGGSFTEFGEKQSQNKIELRARHYF